ncbi:MAG: nucleoside deaminase [Clostridia bacterium]|nr:nucleoside deaminase [Clostridia bacterium]
MEEPMHSEYMKAAIEQAKLALKMGEVPVGAAVVKDGKIIAAAHNMVEKNKDASAHAEMLALSMAAKALGGWRLSGCSLYVTLEPCPMCTGAILNSRVEEVVFGAFDDEMGCCGSRTDLTDGLLSRRVRCIGGVLEEECASLLSGAFRDIR